jgi:hypothetical protein
MEEEEKLELPQSNLLLRNGVLQKNADKDKVTARHPLIEISAINIVRKTEPGYIGIAAAVLSFTYIPYAYMDPGALKVCCLICVVLFSWVFLAISKQTYLELEVGEDSVRYNMSDPDADCEGFVISLKRQWKVARTGTSASETHAEEKKIDGEAPATVKEVA